MSRDGLQIDQLLVSALRGQAVAWPGHRDPGEGVESVFDRIQYHGVAGLLADNMGHLTGWPTEIIRRIREQALAQAMWELRHREVLAELLASLAYAGIVAILLKGTAVAYDLYPNPAARERGDSDVLIAPADLDRTRSALRQLGFDLHPIYEGVVSNLALQEVWSLTCKGGTEHQIDLHCQLINAPALRDILPFAECSANPAELPRLCPDAYTMDRVLTLIHTCIHRAMHVTAPYFVGAATYFGGDRLIWAHDIHLLAGVLSEAEWQRLCALARRKGVSAVCLDGLTAAHRALATAIPQWVREELGAAPSDTRPSQYLLHSRQLARAWQDLLAIPGLRRKLAYARNRSLPSSTFLRGKYPDMAQVPIILLHARRMVELVRARPRRRAGR